MDNIERGFTFIELIVTITIFLVLTVLAIPSFLWIKKSSIDSSYNEAKAFIGHVRNSAILTNNYTCIQKDEDATGLFLKVAYLKQQHIDKAQILRLETNVQISSSLSGQDTLLVCFYPNGFIIEGDSIAPTASSLADIMNTSTKTYYKSITYSEIDEVKLTLNDTGSSNSKSLCLAKGGEFKQCI